jgi:hypothetical protein
LTGGQIVTAGKGIFHTGVGTSQKDTRTGELFHLYQILYMKYATTPLLSKNVVSQKILQNNSQKSNLFVPCTGHLGYNKIRVFGADTFGIRD